MKIFGKNNNKIIHGDALQALNECVEDDSVDFHSSSNKV